MKKIIVFFLILIIGFIGFTYGNDEYGCKDFDVGKLCLNIKNLGDGKFQIEKTFYPKIEKNIYLLACQVLLPDGLLKNIGACTESFEYKGNDGEIKIYIYLESQNSTIKLDLIQTKLSNSENKKLNEFKKKFYLIAQELTKNKKLSTDKNWTNMKNDFTKNLDNLLNNKISDFKTIIDVINGLKRFINYTKLLLKN